MIRLVRHYQSALFIALLERKWHCCWEESSDDKTCVTLPACLYIAGKKVLMIRLVWRYCQDYCSLLLPRPSHPHHPMAGDEDIVVEYFFWIPSSNEDIPSEYFFGCLPHFHGNYTEQLGNLQRMWVFVNYDLRCDEKKLNGDSWGCTIRKKNVFIWFCKVQLLLSCNFVFGR